MTNPFRFLEQITWSKDDTWTEDDANDYNAFLINRGLSQFVDSVHFANDMNAVHHLSSKLQFTYLINSLAKRRRFSKWKKKTDDVDIKALSVFLDLPPSKAEEIRPLLTEPQMEVVRQFHNGTAGDTTNVRRGKAKRSR